MRRSHRGPTVMAACAALALSVPAQEPEEHTSQLKYRASRKWDFILPDETWSRIDGIRIPHAGGNGFRTEKDGLTLAVDSDGDGSLDKKVKGTSGFVVLSAKRADGSPLKYAVRIRLRGRHYEYSGGGAMVGSIRNVPVKLIDQNNNGRFDDYGIDAMIVGGGRAASYLSEVVNLKGALYHFSASEDGTEVHAKAFSGETGTLNLRKHLSLPGKLMSAVVSADDGERSMSFQLAGGSLTVPVGSYRMTGGFATKGGDTARLRHGDMEPMVVRPGQVTSPSWGSPLVAEFHFTRAGNEITVQPQVRFLGRAGEEWHTLLPDAKSPKLAFYDKQRNKLLATKRFEGC